MADSYVAISTTSKTGDPVSGVPGATYDATFSTLKNAIADGTYGERDLVTEGTRQYNENCLN